MEEENKFDGLVATSAAAKASVSGLSLLGAELLGS